MTGELNQHETAVFNYPVDDASNQQYMFSLPLNHQPMLNGQTSFYPAWYLDHDWNRFPSLYTLYALHQHAIQYAMIYTPFLNGDQLNALHDRISQFSNQLKYVNSFNNVEVYQVLAPPRATLLFCASNLTNLPQVTAGTRQSAPMKDLLSTGCKHLKPR